MKQEFTGRFKVPALMDELFTAFPDWRGELAPLELGLAEGARTGALLSVFETERGVVLVFPDDADAKAVEVVVLAHDPNKESLGEATRKERLLALARVKSNPLFADIIKVLGL